MRNNLGPKILTLDLLLINESEVVDILFDNIGKCTSFSATSVLDLLQSLVCDIRKDFLPYLDRSFALISSVIERSSNEPEMVVSAFNCIAHILAFLERHLIGDTDRLFPLIKPLLFHKHKHYIRHFAAQSLAFLIRRSKEFKKLFAEDILGGLVDERSSNHSDAIGKLMSACLRIKDSLYTSAPQLFIALYEILLERTDDVEFFIQCFDVMFKDLLRNLDIAGYRKIWCLLVEQISAAPDTVPNELSLLVMELFFKYAHGKTLTQCSRDVLELVAQLLGNNATDKVIEIVKLLMDKLPVSAGVLELAQTLIKCPALPMEKKFAFVQAYVSNSALEMVMRNTLNAHLSLEVTADWLRGNLRMLVECMVRLVMEKFPIGKRNSWKEYLPCNGVNFNLFMLDNGNSALAEALLAVVCSEEEEEEDRDEELFWMTCLVIPHMHQTNSDRRFIDGLQKKLDVLLAGELTPVTLMGVDTIIDCLMQLDSVMRVGVTINADIDRFIGLLDTHGTGSSLEPVLLEIIHQSISVDAEPQRFSGSTAAFMDKLKSPNHKTRLNCLAVLQAVLGGDEVSVVHALNCCQEVEALLELHDTELAAKERSVTRMMDGMVYKSGMTTVAKGVIVNYLLGLLHVQVASLWKCIGKTLGTFCVGQMSAEEMVANEAVVWDGVKMQLERCGEMDEQETGKKIGEKVEEDTGMEMEEEMEEEVVDEMEEEIEEETGMEIEEEESGDELASCEMQRQYTADKFHKARAANWLMYRLNLVKILATMPTLAGKKTATLSPLLIAVYTGEFLANRPPKRLREDTLVALLQLFAQFPNVSGTHSEARLRGMYQRCLASGQSAIQQAALQALSRCRLPELQQYLERMSALVASGGSSSASEGLQQLPLSTVLPAHRAVLVPLLVRVVAGRLLQTGGKTQQHRKPLIGYLTELQAGEELRLLLTVLVEPLKRGAGTDPCAVASVEEPIEATSAAVRAWLEKAEQQAVPTFVLQSVFKALHRTVSVLRLVMETMLNKLDDTDLASLLRVFLDCYACCQRAKLLHIDHPISQLKPLRQDCAATLLFVFGKVDTFPWSDALLDSVMGLVVRPQVAALVDECQSSVNTTIELALLWSRDERTVTLLTRDMVDAVIALMLRPKLRRETVGCVLVGVLHNVMVHAAEGRCHSETLRPMIAGNVGRIVEYLGGRVRNLKMKKLKGSQAGDLTEAATTRKELLMIQTIVGYVLAAGEGNEAEGQRQHILDMVNSIVLFLVKTNPLAFSSATSEIDNGDSDGKEQLEVDFLRALEAMVAIVDAGHLLRYFE